MQTDISSIVNLDNNYSLEIENNINNLPSDIIDIKNLKFSNIIKKNKLVLLINFNIINEKDYKKILKKLLFIKKIFQLLKREIGIQKSSNTLLGFLLNYDENNKKHHEFILAINAIFYKTRYQRYNYIYDTVCDYLDSNFYGKNLCNFQNNQCEYMRNTSTINGCCRHFKTKWFIPFSKLVPCEYLKEDHTCKAKCISCKLFTCNYLKKVGIKYEIKDILLLNTFFNPLQKYIIKHTPFTPKEKILKRLMLL